MPAGPDDTGHLFGQCFALAQGCVQLSKRLEVPALISLLADTRGARGGERAAARRSPRFRVVASVVVSMDMHSKEALVRDGYVVLRCELVCPLPRCSVG